ncbi:MAG TPA: Txe/YoeB family addiction module toxin [Rhizomicrobium sp.]|jgi:toxin YoeB|nr:Txe/YoeB family addiction module toxin [Rhizomicrobium sp.]
MRVIWSSKAWSEYTEWRVCDLKVAGKINTLIGDIRRNPFTGIGKPEPLKANMKGWWARRITGEHRLVYRILGKRGEDQRLEILQCRFHYE